MARDKRGIRVMIGAAVERFIGWVGGGQVVREGRKGGG